MSIDERLDPDTGLYTHHVFGLLFNHEIARTHRYPSPIVLLRIAMHSNTSTDTKHATENTSSAAHVLSRNLRHVDITAKFGDDFLVLLPATDEAGGSVVGKRLLERFQRDEYNETGNQQTSRIHIGMATHSGGPTASAEAILVQASKALDEARQRGLTALVSFRELATSGI